MPEKAKLNIALIGLGRIAQKAYLPIVAYHPKVNPILCTRSGQTLKYLAERYRINTIYTNVEELLKSKPDAAMVHSTTGSHPYIVTKLLQNDIPVFVDKPLSYALNDVEKIIELASKNELPLYVGFNRRFAPLIRLLKEAAHPVQVNWQKNRVDLPGEPRVFIYDDFIHVVDTLRYLTSGEVNDLHVFARHKNNKLEYLQVQWASEEALLVGSMNRISGRTEEKIEYFTEGNKWIINDLNDGKHFSEEEEKVLTFDNWDTTLYKRGFVDMMEDWINVVQQRRFNPNALDDIWKTHQLCEEILIRSKT